MIRLRNLLPHPRTYEIPVNAAGIRGVRTECAHANTGLKRRDDGRGSDITRAVTTTTKVLPRSLDLGAKGTPGDTSADAYPDALRDVEPFKSAIDRRDLAVVEIKE